MKVNIQAVSFTVDQKLVDFIERKLQKVANIYEKIVDADVYLKLENTSSKENKITEIRLNVPGDSLVVKKQGKTFEECVDESILPLERMVLKYKETR